MRPALTAWRYLCVILLEDGETVHNAYWDRRLRVDRRLDRLRRPKRNAGSRPLRLVLHPFSRGRDVSFNVYGDVACTPPRFCHVIGKLHAEKMAHAPRLRRPMAAAREVLDSVGRKCKIDISGRPRLLGASDATASNPRRDSVRHGVDFRWRSAELHRANPHTGGGR